MALPEGKVNNNTPTLQQTTFIDFKEFIVNGILFKFARDWKQIYGGDSNAAKAAGHELLCIRSVLQLDVPDIFTPLMTLVDYAGFRITAVSLLPIDSTTLGKLLRYPHYFPFPFLNILLPFFSVRIG